MVTKEKPTLPEKLAMKTVVKGSNAVYKNRNRNDKKGKIELEGKNARMVEGIVLLDRVAPAKSSYQYTKSLDLLLNLERSNPTGIAELGSGRTTITIAAYAQSRGVTFVAFEQDPNWTVLVNNSLEKVGLTPCVKTIPITRTEFGAKFDEAIPNNTDFIYLDGPYLPGASRDFRTKTGRPAYDDVPAIIAKKEIQLESLSVLVDGRVDTVDAILASLKDSSLTYAFEPSFEWLIASKHYLAAFVKTSQIHSRICSIC